MGVGDILCVASYVLVRRREAVRRGRLTALLIGVGFPMRLLHGVPDSTAIKQKGKEFKGKERGG